jgi:hypothetical protein
MPRHNRDDQRTPGNLISREPINDNAIGSGFVIPPFFWIIERQWLFRLHASGGAAFALLVYDTQWFGWIFRDAHNLFDRWNVSFLAWFTSPVDNFLGPPPLEWLVT